MYIGLLILLMDVIKLLPSSCSKRISNLNDTDTMTQPDDESYADARVTFCSVAMATYKGLAGQLTGQLNPPCFSRNRSLFTYIKTPSYPPPPNNHSR